MSRLINLIFHDISRFPTRSEIRKLDVGKIASVDWRPRLFCLLDKDRPNTISVTYGDPAAGCEVAPVVAFGPKGPAFGVAFSDPVKVVNYRVNDQELVEELELIARKQRKLDDIRDSLLSYVKS